MQNARIYNNVRFLSSTIREAVAALPDGARTPEVRETQHDNSRWTFDTDEEFFASYRMNPSRAFYKVRIESDEPSSWKGSLTFQVLGSTTEVIVTGSTRAEIERVFTVFEDRKANEAMPTDPDLAPRIFIGHGGSPQWRDLKDHLHEQHGYVINAYEVGARAGHTIRDILDEMLSKSTFAVLVMTAEDETSDGEIRARENVVHETGLFQGRLGFSRVVVLVEEGVIPFSNLQGIHQVRYEKDRIKETYGDVLAAIRREFGAPPGAV